MTVAYSVSCDKDGKINVDNKYLIALYQKYYYYY